MTLRDAGVQDALRDAAGRAERGRPAGSGGHETPEQLGPARPVAGDNRGGARMLRLGASLRRLGVTAWERAAPPTSCWKGTLRTHSLRLIEYVELACPCCYYTYALGWPPTWVWFVAAFASPLCFCCACARARVCVYGSAHVRMCTRAHVCVCAYACVRAPFFERCSPLPRRRAFQVLYSCTRPALPAQGPRKAHASPCVRVISQGLGSACAEAQPTTSAQ